MSRVIRVDVEVLGLIRQRQAAALAAGGRLSVTEALRALMLERNVPVHQVLTPAQRQVLDADGVDLVGVDARGRLVVEKDARWGTPGQPRRRERWAITRAGDPIEVAEPVTLAPAAP